MKSSKLVWLVVAALCFGCFVTGQVFWDADSNECPDPSVIKQDGRYYKYCTNFTIAPFSVPIPFNVPVSRSQHLSGPWEALRDALPNPPSWATRDYWAPSIYRASGPLNLFYLYFTGRNLTSEGHEIGVAYGTSALGPFVPGPKLISNTRHGTGVLDPDIFRDNGQQYLLYSTDFQSTRCAGAPRRIMIQPMSSPMVVSGQAVELLRAEGSNHWENCTVENPSMIKLGSSYYLFYSGGNYEDASYKIGFALCSSALGPCTRVKATGWPKGTGWKSWIQAPGGQDLFFDDTILRMVFHEGPLGDRGMAFTSLTVDPATFLGFETSSSAPPPPPPPPPPSPTYPVYSSNAPAADIESTPDSAGYWIVARNGGVFSFGSAGFYGSPGPINTSIVGMARSASGRGYWLAGADGGVFSYGDAPFHGSASSTGVQNISDIASTAANGYYLVGRDGGIFAFGAPFYNSLPGLGVTPAAEIIGIASRPQADGYWLLGRDGGLFALGNAPFLGRPNVSNASGIAPTPSGNGYWIITTDGRVFPYGDAASGLPGMPAVQNIVGITPRADNGGIWLVGCDGGVFGLAAPYFGNVSRACSVAAY